MPFKLLRSPSLDGGGAIVAPIYLYLGVVVSFDTIATILIAIILTESVSSSYLGVVYFNS